MDQTNTFEKLKQHGYSIKDIYTLTGIPQARVYSWNSGRGMPKVEDEKKLIALLEKTNQPIGDHIGRTVQHEIEREMRDKIEENARKEIPRKDGPLNTREYPGNMWKSLFFAVFEGGGFKYSRFALCRDDFEMVEFYNWISNSAADIAKYLKVEAVVILDMKIIR